MRKFRHKLAWLKERIRRHTFVGGGWVMGAASIVLMISHVAHAASTGGHGGGHGAGEPTINWWVWDGHAPPVGWALVNFSIFVLGLIFVSRRPIAAAFGQRHTTIKRSIDDAAQLHANACTKFDTLERKQKGADAEEQALRERAQQEGEAERLRVIHEAERYAERLQADMGTMSAQEATRMQQKLRVEVIQRALEQAEVYLRDKLTSDEQERLFDQAVTELEASEGPASQRRRMIATPSKPEHGAGALGGAA